MTLDSLGWNDQFAAHFRPFASDGFIAARVAAQHKHACRLLAGALETVNDRGPDLDFEVEVDGVCTGRLLHETLNRADLPVVGDWVVARPRAGESVADIHAVLPRSTAFVRAAAGPRTEAQVLAANVDAVFLVMALDGNFNLRRMERLLASAWESGAEPVVVLNKLDLCADPAAARADLVANTPGADVIAVSALHETGLDELASHLAPGRTVAVLGSSGVGKSTLINRLLGEERQRTGARRDDNSLGRHVTVTRELLPLPCGALIIDTPGLREVGLWDAAGGIGETFADVSAITARCRFGDCAHASEPGCAVREAIESGELDEDRFAAWIKLAREQAFQDRKGNRTTAAATKRMWKQRTLATRQRYRLLGED
jgi:ribosome biogenesis GTPase